MIFKSLKKTVVEGFPEVEFFFEDELVN